MSGRCHQRLGVGKGGCEVGKRGCGVGKEGCGSGIGGWGWACGTGGSGSVSGGTVGCVRGGTGGCAAGRTGVVQDVVELVSQLAECLKWMVVMVGEVFSSVAVFVVVDSFVLYHCEGRI